MRTRRIWRKTMAKAIAILGAFFLSGSLVPHEPLHASEPSAEEAYAITNVGEVDALQTSPDLGTVALGISNEEAARREKVCGQLWNNCKERCINWKLKGSKLSDCRNMCRANYDDCIADIR
jgi:hypothetical protein